MLLSLPIYAPLNALLTYGAQPLLQALKQQVTPPATAPEPRPQHDQVPHPTRGSGFRTHLISVTCNQALDKTMNLDNLTSLIPLPDKSHTTTALRGIEIINSETGTITGTQDGVRGSGATSVWLENRGTIRCNNGHGVKLDGDKPDEVVNQGLIAGGNGVALDLGGGDDTLIIKHGSRFQGSVEGGSGTNQVILDDAEGGHFKGANKMQHLWVGTGTWTLTGAVDDNQDGKVYSGATLINQSRIGGSMAVEPGATYTGGTVTHLNVAGTLLLEPSLTNRTRIKQDLHMDEGSTLAFKVGMGETHSTLKVGNSAHLDGATLKLEVEHESDELLNRQLHIVDAKQITGQFAGITSNLKTLTPELIYTPTGAYVGFKRNAPSA